MNSKITLAGHAATCGKLCQTAKPVAAQESLPDQIVYFFKHIFDTSDWPPRWHCGNWSDFHGWLYIISDLGIWAAYFAIPITLLYVLRKRKDIPFNKIFLLFICFIILCGITHLMDAIIFWWPAYRLSALLRLATAVVSVFTFFVFVKILPLIFSLRTVSQLEEEIEKRRIVEEKLAASEFLLSEAGRIGRAGGWDVNVKTRKRQWSNTVYEIFEFPYDIEIDSIDVLTYFQEPYRNKIEEAIDRATHEGIKWDIEALLVTAKNNKLWVRSIGESLYDDTGTLLSLRGVFIDIDRYKTIELALNKSLELTSQNNIQLKNFTHILSHNIRNHASNIALLTTIVNEEALDEENKEIFEKLKDVSKGLNTTLEDLSEAIKIKEIAVKADDLSFTETTNTILKIFITELETIKAKININFEIDLVLFPHIYLESILTNLISNAIKYRKKDVELLLSLKTYKNALGRTVFECTDNGLGIDLDLHGKKIFGLYKTFHDTADAHGVGLFLVKTQIESQGGEVLVESSPGNGTTFKIIFNEKN